MNYYEHHIGDFLKKTAHLTVIKEGVYRRLLDRYYITEQPLPADVKACCEFARAFSKPERDAVRAVLTEFFTLETDGHHQRRADEEIARYKQKQAKAKASADARWNPHREQSERNANASPEHDATDMRTHSERNANGMHRAPVPSPQTPDNTPIPPQGAKSAVGLKTWLEAIKAKGEKPIPEADSVFAYATEAGIPSEFLRLAWQEFRHRYTQPDAKRYKDWRAVFRKAVRGDWLKLWRCDASGVYTLTTAGVQAQRAHAPREAA